MDDFANEVSRTAPLRARWKTISLRTLLLGLASASANMRGEGRKEGEGEGGDTGKDAVYRRRYVPSFFNIPSSSYSLDAREASIQPRSRLSRNPSRIHEPQ